MTKTDEEVHQESMQRFIQLANQMTEEGMSKYAISAGLMSASCVYATYIAVGNKGSLNQAGIDVIADGYKKQLAAIQQVRQEQAA